MYTYIVQSKRISNDHETDQIPHSALKTKREIHKLTAVYESTRGKANEQLFPRQVVIQLPKIY